ncbi:MAG TPA: anaerobic ribonucleoside-triphosphate reductase activating protein [Ruminococcus sp.]|nr:anaerobic ribonucleoside-triphosphate reductase activating protein [Ruminococcus sp.]
MIIKIAGVANDSIVDGPGLRFTIFVQGCPHRCKGCHNPQTHDFNGGKTETTENLIRQILANPLLDGVTFSGGEPFCQSEPLYEIASFLKKKGYNIITYTGYTFEYLLENADSSNNYMKLLEVSDYIVDGRFEEDKKSYLLKFRGSSNQRIIDCQKSLEKGFAIEHEF